MPKPRLVHKGSKAAEPHLYPLGVAVKLSSATKGLLEDYRVACCLFGQAEGKEQIEASYEKMQMRGKDLAEHLSELERKPIGTLRDAVLKF